MKSMSHIGIILYNYTITNSEVVDSSWFMFLLWFFLWDQFISLYIRKLFLLCDHTVSIESALQIQNSHLPSVCWYPLCSLVGAVVLQKYTYIHPHLLTYTHTFSLITRCRVEEPLCQNELSISSSNWNICPYIDSGRKIAFPCYVLWFHSIPLLLGAF